MDAATKIALYNALSWIESKKNDAGIDTENVEVGIQCLTEAFKIDLHDESSKIAYGVNGASFLEIVNAGINMLGLSVQNGEEKIEEDPVILKNPDLWKKWVAKLDDKGFFKGTDIGTEPYNGRLKKALGKFKEKFADVKPSAPVMTDEEREAKAEAAKGRGNAALSAGKHQEAVDLYAEAIKLSSNGPNSHIYYANHAAALMYLGRYKDVIEDCEQAIALKPSYIKSYSRMGNAQVQLKDYAGAIESFRRGLELESTNTACKEGLAEAEQKLNAENNSRVAAPSDGAGGMPDLSGLAGMFGGGGAGGLAGLMNNPAMQQMAANMMQNPAMMQMAQNMMQNPEMLSNLMGGMGGNAGGNAGGRAPGGGGLPDLAGMANAFRNNPQLMAARSDPDLADFFRDVDRDGPTAALRHMSNPKVSQLIQTAMAGMQ